MVKWKVFLVILLTVVIAVGVAFGIDAIVASTKKTQVKQITHVAIDFYADDVYLGDKAIVDGNTADSFNIVDVLGLDDSAEVESLDTDIAEISENVITVKAYGRLSLQITNDGESVTRNFITVDGVNVTSALDFYTMADDYAVIIQNIVLQNDVEMTELDNFRDKFGGSNYTFRVKSNMYGNGYTVVGGKYVKRWFHSLFIFSGSDCLLRDTRFIGKVVKEGDAVDLDGFFEYGTLVTFGYKSLSKNKTTVVNCVFENSNRNVFIRGADVDFQGCLFRNAADSNVSMETCKDRASAVSFENCVFADCVVAGITNWYADSAPEDCQCTVTLKGFNDFYCWKNSADAKIVPAYQSNANVYNGYIQNQLKTKEARASLVLYNGNYYANSAILVISTSGEANTTAVYGLDKDAIKKYSLPIDYVIAMFLNTSDFYGYRDVSRISPEETLADNPYLYYEMKFGRETA